MRQVFIYEFLRNIRRKGYLFSTFALPVIAVVALFAIQFISSATSNPEDLADAPVLDLEGIRKAGYIDESGLFDTIPADLEGLLLPYASPAEADAAMQRGDIDVYYIIAADYMESGAVTEVVPTLSLSKITSAPIRQLILNTLSVGIDHEVYLRLVRPSNMETINMQQQLPDGAAPQNFDTRFLLVYIFVLALMLSLFVTNGYLMQGVIEEKESRVVEILLSSVQPVQLLAGKILAFSLMGILQLVSWVGVFILIIRLANANLLDSIGVLSSLYVPLDVLPLVLVYFLLAYLFFATAYGVVGAISTSMQEGPQFAVIFTLPAVIPLYFIGIFIETPDAPIVLALSLFPITAPLSMTMRLLISTVPGWQLALSLGLLVLLIIGMIWLAGRLFRVQNLLAGNTPRLRDLPKLLRG